MYLPFIKYYNTNNNRKYLDIIINDVIKNNIELESEDYIIFIKILNNDTYKNLFFDVINYAIYKRIILDNIEEYVTILDNKCSKCENKLKLIDIETEIYQQIMTKIDFEVSKK